jgi:hypothetical protein
MYRCIKLKRRDKGVFNSDACLKDHAWDYETVTEYFRCWGSQTFIKIRQIIYQLWKCCKVFWACSWVNCTPFTASGCFWANPRLKVQAACSVAALWCRLLKAGLVPGQVLILTPPPPPPHRISTDHLVARMGCMAIWNRRYGKQVCNAFSLIKQCDEVGSGHSIKISAWHH